MDFRNFDLKFFGKFLKFLEILHLDLVAAAVAAESEISRPIGLTVHNNLNHIVQ